MMAVCWYSWWSCSTLKTSVDLLDALMISISCSIQGVFCCLYDTMVFQCVSSPFCIGFGGFEVNRSPLALQGRRLEADDSDWNDSNDTNTTSTTATQTTRTETCA